MASVTLAWRSSSHNLRCFITSRIWNVCSTNFSNAPTSSAMPATSLTFLTVETTTSVMWGPTSGLPCTSMCIQAMLHKHVRHTAENTNGWCNNVSLVCLKLWQLTIIEQKCRQFMWWSLSPKHTIKERSCSMPCRTHKFTPVQSYHSCFECEI